LSSFFLIIFKNVSRETLAAVLAGPRFRWHKACIFFLSTQLPWPARTRVRAGSLCRVEIFNQSRLAPRSVSLNKLTTGK
jgi:hypothetical protein